MDDARGRRTRRAAAAVSVSAFAAGISVPLALAGASGVGAANAVTPEVVRPHTFPVSDPTQPATVPSEYQSTQSTISGQVAAFASTTQAASGPSSSAMVMSAADEPADGNTMAPGVLQTTQLSNSERYALQMQEMGNNGITVQVNYPLLVTSFSDSSEYTTFYTELAQYIHSIGLTLTIEDNPLFPSHSSLPVSSFYSSLTLQSLISTDQQQAQTIINDMQPAYVEILAEPDTYTSNFDNPSIDLKNSSTAVTFVNGVLNGLQRNGTRVGAGTGTWQSDAEDQALIGGTSIDFVDMHTYPIAQVDVTNMEQQTADAAAAHLPIVMTETWLYKDSTDGLPYSPTDPQDSSIVEGELVTYSFWEPLDQQFLTAMVNYARNNNFALISPFHSTGYFAYQNWQPAFDNETSDQIASSFNKSVSAARNAGVVSQVGGTIENLDAAITPTSSTTTSSTATSTSSTTSAPGSSTSTTRPKATTTTTKPTSTTTTTPAGAGYWMLDQGGDVYAFGSAQKLGSAPLAANPWVAIAAIPGGGGYWTVTSVGRVTAFGSAQDYTLSATPASPVVSIASTSDGLGFWLATSGGQVIEAGDAHDYGSPSKSGLTLAKGIVNMVPTSDGLGYWLLGGDGGVLTYGDAGFFGSTGGKTLNKPAVAMAPVADGKGYLFVASDGGMFAFGDATYFGSAYQLNPNLPPGGTNSVAPLNKPVNGIVVTPDGGGYWLVASDGGVFTFGDAGFVGSLGSTPPATPVVGFAAV